MSKRVTLKDIAKRAGVHQSSVSMALRGHPRIGKETRIRIRKLAEEMGYRPDPGLSALAAYRSSIRPIARTGEIAVFVYGNENSTKRPLNSKIMMTGLVERAETLGYSATFFDLSNPSLSPEQVNRIIKARNIQGLIISQMELPQNAFLQAIDWENVTAVRITRNPRWPPVTRIAFNQYDTMQLILYKILIRGYRRIGLVQQRSNLKTISHYPEAAYQQTLNRVKKTTPYPTFYNDNPDPSKLIEWAEKYELDAIVSNEMPIRLIPNAKQRKAFFEDRAFVCMNLIKPYGNVAGVDQHLLNLGRRAVEVLVAQILRADRGFPDSVSTVMVEGEWIDGKSLIRRL